MNDVTHYSIATLNLASYYFGTYSEKPFYEVRKAKCTHIKILSRIKALRKTVWPARVTIRLTCPAWPSASYNFDEGVLFNGLWNCDQTSLCHDLLQLRRDLCINNVICLEDKMFKHTDWWYRRRIKRCTTKFGLRSILLTLIRERFRLHFCRT